VGVTTITTDNLLSHAEVSRKWGETDHLDPVDYFAQYGKTVDMFRSEVQAAINGKSYSGATVSTPVVNEAMKLQQVLNKLKIRDGKGNALDEDGIIGGCTKEAVKRLQTVCGLTVDGIAGGQTWNAINDILARPLLQVGSKGLVVRYLQYRVGCTYDGDFGWDTNRHVAIWQSQNFCTQDGIVGSQTWNKMIG
jgi:N-acetylmuramoyl-L-alanine amidase